MSMTDPDPTATRAGTAQVRGETSDSFPVHSHRVRETKPSFATTEFWFTLGGVAALIVFYNVADDASLDLWRTSLLCTLLGMAYIVSRGIAKAGARNERWREERIGGRY